VERSVVPGGENLDAKAPGFFVFRAALAILAGAMAGDPFVRPMQSRCYAAVMRAPTADA